MMLSRSNFEVATSAGSNEDAVVRLSTNNDAVVAVEANQGRNAIKTVSAPDLATFGFASFVAKTPGKREKYDRKTARRRLGIFMGFKPNLKDEAPQDSELSVVALAMVDNPDALNVVADNVKKKMRASTIRPTDPMCLWGAIM